MIYDVPGTQIMGILNITEDSFSDGGQYLQVEAALAHAELLLSQGANIIDVGGESTRPGATRVSEQLELQRVIPVVTELHARGITVSVDTMRANVAAAAVAAGADLINDVSGGLADPNMLKVVAETGVPVCLMHWETEKFGNAAGAAHTRESVVADVVAKLQTLVDAAVHAGIAPEAISLDPGLGFAKTAEDNWELLRALDTLQSLGFPLLIGASRKRFLQALGGDVDAATATLSAYLADADTWCVRVHNVAATAASLQVARQLHKIPNRDTYRWKK